MVYTIDYIDKNGQSWCLFDIQIWVDHRYDIWRVGEGWRTDCNCICFGQCIAQYIYDGNIKDDENLKDFQKDVSDIVEIRGFLHEHHRNDWYTGGTILNGDKKGEQEAYDRMKKEFIPDIEKKLTEFANKWNFKIRK